MDIQILVAGFIVGTMIGVSGMGGGALMGPILIFFLGVKPTIAVGTDLMFASITKALGGWEHHRHKTVDYDFVKVLFAGSFPGAVAGMTVLYMVKAHSTIHVDHFIKKALALIILFVAASVLYRALFRKEEYRCLEKGCNLTPKKKHYLILFGFFVGFLVSLTSVGSGTLVVLFLSLFFRLCPRRMVGTDIVHGLLLTGTAGILHMWAGHVNFHLLFNLLAGSLPGVYIGSNLCVRLPRDAVRYVLAASLFFVGFKLF